MTPGDCRRRMDVVYARAQEKFEAQYVRAGDKLYFPGLGNVEVTSVSPPNSHAFVHMELSNGRYLDLDMYERVQRQTAVESLPSCSSCGSAPRMSAQAMQRYGRGEHGPGTSKIVDLRHHDGAISSGRVVEERGRTRDSWVVAWSSGPLSGETTIFSRVQLPGETDLGWLSLRETAESLPSRGTCGRTPKERRQAEHIAESYEGRGLDARTSKSRACATVNARRNEQMEDRGRNSVHHANIADAGLTAAWRGLTESLPSPKHAGRKGNGFNPGEHVIRLGDMIKMEGALGGYVEGINRVAGTAKIEQDNGVLTTWPLVSLMRDTPENRDLQQEYNDKIDAEVNARLELSLAKWKAL